ncbi:MAG: AAA family ATPase [Candidatus Omnitrophica bacterium]|nr:AAA family ATPase [Candidatus Omnitrophota bacterium]
MLSRKIKLFFMEHWVKFVITFAIILLIALAIWGLMSLESFYAKLTIATLPLQLLMVALNAFIFVYFYMTIFRGGIGQMKKELIKSEDVNIHFSDVIGMEEAKREAMEVVQLLKDRKMVQKIGGKVIRGILMVGPPGCGKTYLAKAIATEAGIPFISASGSEFVEVFVGVGPARVRQLFKKARRLAYGYGACILFIDELDAVGRSRSVDLGFGARTEQNNTVNQLLIEMDGLNARQEDVVIIGATNAQERVLDQALLRPGRFDRKIYVDRPNFEEREKIFQYYFKKIKYDSSIDFKKLAMRTVWKSPADIENIVKESALIAARNKRDKIIFRDISEAIERVDLGLKHRKKMTPDERRRVAYHEAGHLIVTYFLHPTDDVFKASIISRRDALGVVYHQPSEELFLHNRGRILGNIKIALAGYVAEKMKCGSTSDGVSGDFQQAMVEANFMVWSLGMGSNGFIGDYEMLLSAGLIEGRGDKLSDKIKEKLNEETHVILQQCLKDVEALIKKEEVILDRFANELLIKEELEYDEIEAIFAEYGKARKDKINIQPESK